jgi:hypothetical protein
MVTKCKEQQQELGQATTPAIHYLDTKLLAKMTQFTNYKIQQRASNSGTHKLV